MLYDKILRTDLNNIFIFWSTTLITSNLILKYIINLIKKNFSLLDIDIKKTLVNKNRKTQCDHGRDKPILEAISILKFRF